MNKCIICNSINSSVIFKKDGYDFFKCKDCSLVYIYPQLDQEELVKYYSSDKVVSKRKRFTEVLNRLGKGGNLLDVGYSNGEFMRLAKGFNVYGVEINEKMKGDNIFNGTLTEAKFEDSFFSVIFLGDIIEHVSDPAALLRECKRILKKDGTMVISTPNYNCFWCGATQVLHKWFRFPLSIAVPPYHPYIFSITNIDKLLNNMGFKVLDIKHHRCSLRHELGNTGLYQRKDVRLLLVFPVYILTYLVDYLITPFKEKDYNMTLFVSWK